jgi:peroxiredoxin
MRSQMKDDGDDHWSMTDADAALHAACHPRSESDAFRIRGEPVILAFHSADWSPACDDQMTLNNEILVFRKHAAGLSGISVEGVWYRAAFARDRRAAFAAARRFNPRTTSTAPVAQARASASAQYLPSKWRAA